jgi:pimeloyl-ACP methyl ester carboxylesterase
VPQIQANSLLLEYEVFGSPGDPPVLLIMGLGMQMTRWPIPFCEQLASHGYRVIRFDNRDVGRSTWFSHVPPLDLLGLMQSLMMGRPVEVPYSLADMAADAIGLLDALQIEAAHLVGASMGGMIAQLVATHYRHRTWSLSSLMASSGNPAWSRPSPEILTRIMVRPAADPQSLLDHGIETLRVMASRSYEFNAAEARMRVQADLDRGHNPAGVTRQLAATAVTGDRRAQLQDIVAPTLVLHGADDPLFPVAAAHELAQCIAGAHLKVIPGMGHELPEHIIQPVVAAIVGNLHRAVRC